MADQEDLELESERDTGGSSSQIVRKNISLKLKTTSKPRGRPKKVSKATEKGKKAAGGKKYADEVETGPSERGDKKSGRMPSPVKLQGPSEPYHKNQPLFWNHKVCIIGEKVVDPLIHCCEKCALPILIYGRMIPCKHVFCFDCAKKTEKNCPRCNDPVTRIEQSAVGTVFVCTYGGAKHGVSGCRRTYLSQRDLQSHISHRHIKPAEAAAAAQAAAAQAAASGQATTQSLTPPKPQIPEYKTRHGPPPPPEGHGLPPPPPPQQHSVSHDPQMVYHTRPMVDDVRSMHPHMQGPPPGMHPSQQPHAMLPPPQQPPPPQPHPTPPPPTSHPPPHVHPAQPHDNYQIPVMSSSRTNLITVPIQDEYRHSDHGGSGGGGGGYSAPPPHPGSMPPHQGIAPPHQGSIQHTAPPGPGAYTQPPPTHLPPPSHQPQQHFPSSSLPPPLHPAGMPPGSFSNPPPISHPGSMVYSTPPQMQQHPPPMPNLSHPPPITGQTHLSHPMPPISHGPPLSHAPPPVMTSAPIMSHPTGPPPPLHATGPPLSHTGGPPPPQRYASPHTGYEENPMTPPYVQPGGGHSPRTPWPGSGPQPRGPPPPRPPTNTGNMAPPPHTRGQYYQ